MGRRSQAAATDLRRAVEVLPPATRTAMLAAVREGRILTGAYTDGDGGACPMLAAHRRGARSSAHAFARAWDRFTGVRPGASRPASARELSALATALQRSLDPSAATDLGAALAEHQALARRRRAREAAALGTRWLQPRNGSFGPEAPVAGEPFRLEPPGARGSFRLEPPARPPGVRQRTR